MTIMSEYSSDTMYKYNSNTDLSVSILPVYDAPPDVILGEDEYRAASQLTLSCQVTGTTGTLTYQWSSTCTGDCFLLGNNENADTTAQNISTSFRGNKSNFFLRSTDAGTYTCTATDGNGNTGSAFREVKIVGELTIALLAKYNYKNTIFTAYDIVIVSK